MLYSAKTTIAVAKHLHENEIPFVLDPVIEAEAGGRLLRPEAVLALKKHLIPLARVVTPNIFEAEALTGIHVSDIDSADAAAREILEMGAEASVVKGWTHGLHRSAAHGRGSVSPSWKRMAGGNHGVGCTYSAALTSFLAKGCSLPMAAIKAKKAAALAVSHSMKVGQGVGPVNQAALIRDDTYAIFAACARRKVIQCLGDGKI